MNPKSKQSPAPKVPASSSLRALVLSALLVASATLFAACGTTAEVRDLVAESNAAVLMAESPVLVTAPTGSDSSGTGQRLGGEADLITRIDTFIETHPERPATLNALRIRKAMLLLQSRQPNLARAAFENFDPAIAGNTRDRALYDARNSLLFWWAVAGLQDPGQFPTDRRFASQQAELETVIDGLPPTSVRAYLAALHAQMVMKRVENVDATRGRPMLQAAFARYIGEFSADERRATGALFDPSSDASVFRSVPESRIRFLGQIPAMRDRFVRTWGRIGEDNQPAPFRREASWIP